MKKKLSFGLLVSLFLLSCTDKKVSFKGDVKSLSPSQRLELIDATGSFSLPIANLGANAQGKISAVSDIPKSGVYAIFSGGKVNLVYLEGGEQINISEDSEKGPLIFSVVGKTEKNNNFLKNTQNFVQNHVSKMDTIMSLPEKDFLAEIKGIKSDIDKKIDSVAKSYSVDAQLIKWKKNETSVDILGFFPQYEMMHGIKKPEEKLSSEFYDFQKSIEDNPEELIKMYSYRVYLLNKMSPDFQKYVEKNAAEYEKKEIKVTEKFINFLAEQKDYSQIVKDYLIAFVAMQLDLNPQSGDPKALNELLEKSIKNSAVKEDFYRVENAVFGLKKGTKIPNSTYLTLDGKKVSSDTFTKKPTVMMFYTSWNTYIEGYILPALKEELPSYKDKVNFVFINLDDDINQFKTAVEGMMKGIEGTNLYADGGINSAIAKKYGVYSFKIPCFLIIDQDGKIAERSFLRIDDPLLKETLDKLISPEAKPSEEAKTSEQVKSPEEEKPTEKVQPSEEAKPAKPSSKGTLDKNKKKKNVSGS